MRNTQREPIAIIGMGCRFPGANNLQEFWRLLRAGKDAIQEVPANRWDIQRLYDPDRTIPGKTVSRWGGFLDSVEQFDWRSLRMLPREATSMDPQHRLLLEVAWEALEDAGLPLKEVAGSQTSVSIGIASNDYLRLQARNWSQLDEYTAMGNANSFAASRLSYLFDLKGPSVSVDTGCTSSLSALSLACQSLWAGEACLALAGGVSLMLSPESMIMQSKAGLLSRDGRCKTLDAHADGFVRGEGAGLVVLKPLSQVSRSDRVYALIRGVAVNHNGHNEWIIASSQTAQEALLRDTYRKASVHPSQVDYVELHGTGFQRGDSTETKALGAVLGSCPERMHACFVGSVKTNIGHLEAASGMASVIKVALSLSHRYIPATLNIETVNPDIPLDDLHLAVPQTGVSWPEKAGTGQAQADRGRRDSGLPLSVSLRVPTAGVTTLAFSGINAHAVLTAYPDTVNEEQRQDESGEPVYHLLPISARSKQALDALAVAYRDFLTSPPNVTYSWRDICYTASVRRTHHSYRLAVFGRTAQEAVKELNVYLQEEEGRDEPPPPHLEALKALYMEGAEVDWSELFWGEECHCVGLPTYAWQRERLWPEWLDVEEISTPPEARSAALCRNDKVALHFAPGQIETMGREVIEVLTELWEKVLGLAKVNPDDSFFQLGGHSLLAQSLLEHIQAVFQVEITLVDLFVAATPSACAQIVMQRMTAQTNTECMRAVPFSPIEPDPIHRYEPFPTTDVQQAYWAGRHAAESGNVGNHAYIEVEAADLDLDRLKWALQRLIEQHEMLRTVLLPDGQQQILAQVPPFEIKVVDLRGQEPHEQARQLEQIRRTLDHQLLSVDRWPAFELWASRLDEQHVRLHLSIESIFVDAWSMNMLIHECVRFYYEPDLTLPAPSLSFRDYVLALASLQSSAQYQRSREYWLARLPSLPPAPDLPLVSENERTQQRLRFVHREARLEREHWQRLKACAAKIGVTPSGALLTAFAEVIALWSKTACFSLNLSTFNRLPLHPSVNEIAGDFTSLVVLAVDHTTSASFENRAKTIQEQLWRDLDHSFYSGIAVLRELVRMQGGGIKAIMPIVFTSLLIQDTAIGASGQLPPWGKTLYCVSQTPQVWLDHQVLEREGALVFHWQSADAMFPAGLIDAMFATYCQLLQRLASLETSWASPMVWELLPEQQRALLAQVNATKAPVSDKLLHTFFLEQAVQRPNQLALICSTHRLSYKQVYSGALQLAHQLRAWGIGPHQLVGVVMEKGWEQVVAVLGILLSGAAYLPIDANLPEERLRYLLEDGLGVATAQTQDTVPALPVVLTQSWVDRRTEWPKNLQRICVNSLDLDKEDIPELVSVQEPDDLVYVIYTSGSTGVPKGVQISHRGAVNTILDINRRFHVSSADRVLSLSALNFDLSVYDIFGLLAAGGTIVLPTEETLRDPASWLKMIEQEQVTIWNTVPALMQMLVEYAEPQFPTGSLRLALLSGDWIPPSLPDQVKQCIPGIQVISLGGATEASIWSILYPIETVDPSCRRWSCATVPYGRPMSNQRFFVLNALLEPCPMWVTGYLYIGGIGLAKGYWHDEEKTQASFLIHSHTGERLYRTGDLGRYLPDGTIEFLGREDSQVKVAGHRIELGEIEATLLSHPMVSQAVATTVGNRFENKRLIAYVVPLAEQTTPSHQGEDTSESPVDWERLVSNCQTYRQMLSEPMVDDTFLQVWQMLEQISLYIICKTLRDLGVFGTSDEHYSVDELIQRCCIHPRYTKWLQRNLRVLVQSGRAISARDISINIREQHGVFICEKPLPSITVDELWSMYQTATARLTDPALHDLGWNGNIPLLPFQRVKHLKTVLTEELHSAEIYVSSTEMGEIYRLFHYGGMLMREIVEEVLRQARHEKKIRILEIGAGFGIVTAYLLPIMPASRTEYVYTDISAYFLQEAQEQFAAYTNVSYALLDIEQDPHRQGYTWHDFDIVIAASVLHATTNMAETLTHVRSLLKPHGLLLLLEGTHFHSLFDLTMGLQQGIDRFEDTDLRQSHPLLSRDMWHEALKAQDFVSSVIFNKAGTLTDFLGVDVLLAQGPARVAPLPLTQLYEHLRSKLPEYMLPARIVPLETLPLTANGKVDRSALPNPLLPSYEHSHLVSQPLGSMAARTPTEQTLAQLWSEILNRSDVGIDENFLQLGGDSLLVVKLLTRIRATFQIELPFQVIFRNLTIVAMADAIERYQIMQTEQTGGKTVKAEPSTDIPLSFAQQRLWFLDRLHPESTAYVFPVALRLSGSLNIQVLEQSLTELVRRHEILRTTFVEVELAQGANPTAPTFGHPVQVICSQSIFSLPLVDLRGQAAELRMDEGHQLIRQEAHKPFDLAQGPLLRYIMLRLDVQEHVLLLTLHHMIGDGQSLGIYLDELTELYKAFAAGLPSPLPDLPMQYADFAVRQHEWLHKGGYEQQLAYWAKQLDGLVPLSLPTDYPHPSIQTFHGVHQSYHLPPVLLNQLKDLCHQEGVTLYMTLLAAFLTLLSRYTGQTDIAIGTVVTNRRRPEIERLIGFFVDTFVMRLQLSQDFPFRIVLGKVREKVIEMMANQDIPFEEVVARLQPERHLSASPFFQIVFTSRDSLPTDLSLGDVLMTLLPVESGTAKFDLTIEMMEIGQGLILTWEYNTDLFEQSTIQRMIGMYQQLLASIAANPDQLVRDLSLLTDDARAQLLVAWNATQADYPQELCLHHLIEQQVERTPDAIAVTQSVTTSSSEQVALTYAELNRRANQLAHHLQRLGVGPEVCVGLFLERSLELITALLAVLKAGGAYVPLEPTYPAERLTWMLQEVQPPMLLTQTHLMPQVEQNLELQHAQCIDVQTHWEPLCAGAECNPVSSVTPKNLLYVIYTSGSTGKPKGVMNTHRGLCNRLVWMQQTYQLNAADRVLQKTPFSFDVSVWEFFWPLLTGASLVIAQPGGHQDPAYLKMLVIEEQVTTLHFVPSMLSVFLEESNLQKCTSLRQVMCSGEVLTAELQERFFACFSAEEFAPVQLHNLYGPTEAAIDVTYWPCQWESSHPGRPNGYDRVPIGRPIANTQIYLLDKYLCPVPIGVPAEVYIGGIGLARGYCEEPERTAEKFIPNPFGGADAGSRLYRTGDLARYRVDGVIEFLGRLDHQVKLRGYRIELGEIETTLMRHVAVHACVVTYGPVPHAGREELLAYVVGEGLNRPTTVELRSHLRKSLPDYMIPAYFMFLETLPLASNGKIDYRALPMPGEALLGERGAPADARTPIEELLAGLWGEVLGLTQVGSDENFFDLGGHSLLVTQLIARMRTILGVEVAIRAMFENPTVAGLARQVEQMKHLGGGMSVPTLGPIPRPEEIPLSFAQQGLWFLEQLEPGGTAYLIASAFRFQQDLSVEALERSLEELVHRHESLRTTFEKRAGRAVQVIHPSGNFPLCEGHWARLPVIDLQGLGQERREKERRWLARQEAQQPCDLAAGPLLRTYLLRLQRQEHVLLLTLHHIIADGWSNQVLVHDLAVLYQAFVAGRPTPLAPLPIQYADYTLWQRQWLQDEMLEQHLRYWKSQLSGPLPILHLPTSSSHSGLPRRVEQAPPPQQTSQGATYFFCLPAPLADNLKALGRQEGATLFMILFAAFNVLLYYHTGQDDLVVGTDVANRSQIETEHIIGFFVNQLVLRTDLTDNPSFREVVRRVRQVSLDAYAHQDLPFEYLVKALNLERDLSHTPLFQVKFVLQNVPVSPTGTPTPWSRGKPRPPVPKELSPDGSLQINAVEYEQRTAKFDLIFNIWENDHDLPGWMEYRTDLFTEEMIGQFVQHFEKLIRQVMILPDTRLDSIQYFLATADREEQSTQEQEFRLQRLQKLGQMKRKAKS